MLNSNVKINQNMNECDLEGNIGDWGYFIDPSDPKRRNIYKQEKPKTIISKQPNFDTIFEDEIYEFEEGDYNYNIISKISTFGIILNTVYVIQYVLCRLPSKFWCN